MSSNTLSTSLTGTRWTFLHDSGDDIELHYHKIKQISEFDSNSKAWYEVRYREHDSNRKYGIGDTLPFVVSKSGENPVFVIGEVDGIDSYTCHREIVVCTERLPKNNDFRDLVHDR